MLGDRPGCPTPWRLDITLSHRHPY